jgi:hypothetical protein
MDGAEDVYRLARGKHCTVAESIQIANKELIRKANAASLSNRK